MGRIRGRGKRRSSSLDSTARSPFVFLVEDGEEVVGPSSAPLTRVKPLDGAGSSRPSMPPNPSEVQVVPSSGSNVVPMPISPNQGGPRVVPLPRPKSPDDVPMPISPNQGGPRTVPLPRPKSPDVVPMPISPNQGPPHMIIPVSRPKSPDVVRMPVSPNQRRPHIVPLPRPRSPVVVPMLVSPDQGEPSIVPLSRPGSPEVVPMPMDPNSSTTFSNVCNICGKQFKNHRAMWGHKGSHNRIRASWSKRRSKPQQSPSPPPPPSALAVRPNGSDQPGPRVSLELGLALANGATRGTKPLLLRRSGFPPMRGPTREWLRFKEWLARPVFDPTAVQRNPTCFVQPLSDEELELKLGI